MKSREIVVAAIAGGLAVGILLTLAFGQIITGTEHAEQVGASAARTSQEAKVGAARATAAASVSREIAEAVKGDREQTILRTCQEQNARHAGSVAYLTSLAHKEIHEAKPGKKRRAKRAEALRGLAEFKLLFDALAPVQNCPQLVQKEG